MSLVALLHILLSPDIFQVVVTVWKYLEDFPAIFSTSDDESVPNLVIASFLPGTGSELGSIMSVGANDMQETCLGFLEVKKKSPSNWK